MMDDDDDDAAGWYALGRDGEEDMLDGTPPNNGDASTANASEAMAVQRRSRGDEIMLRSGRRERCAIAETIEAGRPHLPKT